MSKSRVSRQQQKRKQQNLELMKKIQKQLEERAKVLQYKLKRYGDMLWRKDSRAARLDKKGDL